MFERYIESLVVACVNHFISQIIEQGRRVQKLLNFNLISYRSPRLQYQHYEYLDCSAGQEKGHAQLACDRPTKVTTTCNRVIPYTFVSNNSSVNPPRITKNNENIVFRDISVSS